MQLKLGKRFGAKRIKFPWSLDMQLSGQLVLTCIQFVPSWKTSKDAKPCSPLSRPRWFMDRRLFNLQKSHLTVIRFSFVFYKEIVKDEFLCFNGKSLPWSQTCKKTRGCADDTHIPSICGEIYRVLLSYLTLLIRVKVPILCMCM